MIALNVPAIEEVQQEFAAFLPELSSRLSCRFRRRDPEAKEDAVAEGVGTAWQMYRAARLSGKTVTVGSIAFFAGKSVDAGRKMAGSSGIDAMADGAPARRKMPENVSLDDSCAAFCVVFGDRRWKWPIVSYVAASMDWDQFASQCSRRDRQIIKLKRAGWQQREIAHRLKISPPAINQHLRRLWDRWQATSPA